VALGIKSESKILVSQIGERLRL